ncbi:hypothetical protein AB0K09_21305, partial [Streptomyces sp. NPDC049577]
QQAMNDFIDGPRGSVEEADSLLAALSARLSDLLGERRHALRAAWQEEGAQPETERLRLALLDYRRLVERLLTL